MTVCNCGYAALSATSGMVPHKYETRSPLADEILIKVLYCGICHSDIHMAKNEWKATQYPIVPGHEFVGVVHAVGESCSTLKVGDHVGVGCMISSCGKCDNCRKGCEQYCDEGMVQTYNGNFRGSVTTGGYGQYSICRESYAIKIPSSLPLEKIAPLLCAGITTYSPIKHYGMHKGGYKVGVLGFGGLGHMAVQFAAAYGNEVYVFSRNMNKAELAMKLGAKGVIVISNQEQLAAHMNSFDFLLDTIPTDKPIDIYMACLKSFGKHILLGLPSADTKLSVSTFDLLRGQKSLEASCIGGIELTREMVNFCAEKNIVPMTELIPCSYVNEAFERVEKGDVLFRFVIDVGMTAPHSDATCA